MTIETIRIEGTATPFSRIGLGTWAIGGWVWGGADNARSVETIIDAILTEHIKDPVGPEFMAPPARQA